MYNNKKRVLSAAPSWTDLSGAVHSEKVLTLDKELTPRNTDTYCTTVIEIIDTWRLRAERDSLTSDRF